MSLSLFSCLRYKIFCKLIVFFPVSKQESVAFRVFLISYLISYCIYLFNKPHYKPYCSYTKIIGIQYKP